MSKKTLSKKLQGIRDNMTCALPECGRIFKATDSQTYHFYYEGIPAYCSPGCKSIGMGRKVSAIRAKPLQECICESCEEIFLSKDPRRFCSVMCWTASPEFREHLARISHKGREAFKKKCADARPVCPVCEINPVKPGRKFCSKKCWRLFYAALFDYQIANPSTIEEIHGYDEYLSQEELPCLVGGCDWKGKHLAVHLNHAHGIRAEDFKKRAGFNLKTGLVAPDMKQHMKDTHSHTGLPREIFMVKVYAKQAGKYSRNRYFSREAREHREKAILLREYLREEKE